jgi:hypothetical protein
MHEHIHTVSFGPPGLHFACRLFLVHGVKIRNEVSAAFCTLPFFRCLYPLHWDSVYRDLTKLPSLESGAFLGRGLWMLAWNALLYVVLVGLL